MRRFFAPEEPASAGPRPASLAVLVLLLLMPGLHGDVGWYDAGELAAAATTLGVPHATGFPLFDLAGYALQLLPVGTTAFRIGLLGAVGVAAATGLAYAVARAHGARGWPAAASALLLPALPVVWLHGTRIEVYGPNVGLLALFVWCLLGRRRRLGAAAFVTGVGLGAHATFVLTALALWGLVVAREPRTLGPRLPALLGWGGLGALVLLYLPLAASGDPWVNRGDPSTPARLWAHLTGAGIRRSFEGSMGFRGWVTWLDVTRWAELAGGPRPLVPLTLAVAGAVLGPRRLGVPVLLGLLVDLLFSVLLNPMGQAARQTGVPGAWWTVLGVAMLAGRLGRDGVRGPVVALLALGMAAHAVAAGRTPRWTEPELAGATGRMALAEAAPGSLVLPSTDHLASLSLYLRAVEGWRPDLVVVPKQQLPVERVVRRRYAAVGATPPEAFTDLEPQRVRKRLGALVRAELPHRSVFWELGDGRFDPLVAERLSPTGLLYRLRPGSEPTKPGRLQPPSALLRGALSPSRRPGPRSAHVLSELDRLRGVWHLLRREVEAAASVLEHAIGLDAANEQALLNLAAARRRQGRLDEAIALLERAVDVAPTYAKAWSNLASYREAAGDAAGAERARRRRRRLGAE